MLHDTAISQRRTTLHVLLGFHHIRLGRFEKARTCFERSQTLFEKIDRTPPYRFATDPLTGFGLLELILGNYAEAVTIAEEARRQNRDRGEGQHCLVPSLHRRHAAVLGRQPVS